MSPPFYNRPKPRKGQIRDAHNRSPGPSGLVRGVAKRVGDFGEGLGKSVGHAAHDVLHGLGKLRP